MLGQNYPNLEYIVLDGRSEDNSAEIIARHGASLAFWRSHKDDGQSAAIAEGWQRSTGDILAWLNSDDYYAPGALARVADIFASEPATMVVWGTVRLVDQEGLLLRDKAPQALSARDFLLCKDVPGQAAAFVRREVFEKLGPPRKDLHYVMDWELWLRIALNYPPGAVRCVDEVFAFATEWAGAKTLTAETRDLDEIRRVLAEVFQSASLPQELRELQRRAFARTWWRQSKAQLEMGERRKASVSLMRAWRLSPTSFSVGKTLRQVKRIVFYRPKGGPELKRDRRAGVDKSA